jgi:hypothetical protein
MVGDARTIEQLDTTRVLLSKRSTSPIDQQPFSGRLFHSQTPKTREVLCNTELATLDPESTNYLITLLRLTPL